MKKRLFKMMSVFMCSTLIMTSATTASVVGQSSTAEASTNLKVSYINVGQGDSTLIQYGSKSMLIDGGLASRGATVVSYLKSKKIKTIDYVIGTHPDADHIGGLTDVVNSFKVKKIIMPDKSNATITYGNLLSAIKDKGLKIARPKVGTNYKLGKVSIKVIAPNGSYSDNNNNSIACRATYKKTSFMFTGDCEQDALSDIMSNGQKLQSTVLKCGHHGSKNATNDTWMSKVKPKYAVISVGKNSYGHPNAETINLLKKYKVKTYRTDKSGTVIATSNGKKVTFNCKATKLITSSTSSSSKKSTSSSTSKKSTKSSTSKSVGKTVYVTDTGKKYHVSGCRYLRSSSIKISLSDAKSQGYTPCSICCN